MACRVVEKAFNLFIRQNQSISWAKCLSASLNCTLDWEQLMLNYLFIADQYHEFVHIGLFFEVNSEIIKSIIYLSLQKFKDKVIILLLKQLQ